MHREIERLRSEIASVRSNDQIEFYARAARAAGHGEVVVIVGGGDLIHYDMETRSALTQADYNAVEARCLFHMACDGVLSDAHISQLINGGTQKKVFDDLLTLKPDKTRKREKDWEQRDRKRRRR